MKKYNKYIRVKELALNIIVCTLLITAPCFTVKAIANATKNDIEVVNISDITEPMEHELNTVEVSYDIPKLYGGVSEYIFNIDKDIDYKTITKEETTVTEELPYIEEFGEPWVIRCTGYCDYGYTKSGEYVREGIIAGKEEWLGKTAVIYRYNEDGSIGEFIGYYEFLDTGYGINGSLINGTSVDIWHPSEDAVWDWVAEYGDYVYIQIVDMVG